jgi:hypothetical protein
MNDNAIPPIYGDRLIVAKLSCVVMDITPAEQAYMVSVWGQTVPLISNETGMVIPVATMTFMLEKHRNAQYAPLLEALDYAHKQGADYAVTKVVGELR